MYVSKCILQPVEAGGKLASLDDIPESVEGWLLYQVRAHHHRAGHAPHVISDVGSRWCLCTVCQVILTVPLVLPAGEK